MKKLMIAAAIVCAAIASQASSCTWGSGKLWSVNADGTWNTDLSMKADSNIKSFALTAYLYDYVDSSYKLVGIDSKSAKPTNPGSTLSGTFYAVDAGGKKTDSYFTIDQSHEYYVVLEMTGDFGNGAVQTFTANSYEDGAFTTPPTGNGSIAFDTLGITDTTATQWSAVPEPTSGLLLLLGVAGLALKRKRA